MYKKSGLVLSVVVAATAFLGGCGGKQANAPAPENVQEAAVNTEPVTITILSTGGLPEAELDMMYALAMKQYPHITIKKLTGKIENLVTTGDTPDIIITHTGNIDSYLDFNLLTDITPLVKKYKVDLSRLDQVALNAHRVTKADELNGLPFWENFIALYYNKDIFDKFGVEYPRDGMTWDETIELARKVSREEGGTQYQGLAQYAIQRFGRIMGASLYDTRNMKGTFETPEWKQAFELVDKIHSIPGNEAPVPFTTVRNDSFLKNRNLAMFATVNLLTLLAEAGKSGMNWDVVQYPSLPGHKNVFDEVNAGSLAITSTSKHKDAAMHVLMAFVSDEMQSMIARKLARQTAMQDPKFNNELGADIPELKGKNITGIFKSHAVDLKNRGKYVGQVGTILEKHFVDYYNKQVDVNTALRAANEEANKLLQAAK
ncbi:extracellular solute-binding protein [Paenibacillus hemerocallicola]|uniref:Extracellular solute-binding protein n=1 Tax=Paenibacillus hemerocallicola TaxID=1172614 RepID=A0A5C4T8X0_9BACL|nr:extracellular solute-binding protein [Paenibacillus hemerocallicola]TNJ65518.1 extracellular solute-binding protein [Paenibacillus hemerocallicola]